MLNIYILLQQLILHLLQHGVTLCFTYVVDDDDPQTDMKHSVTPCESVILAAYLLNVYDIVHFIFAEFSRFGNYVLFDIFCIKGSTKDDVFHEMVDVL